MRSLVRWWCTGRAHGPAFTAPNPAFERTRRKRRAAQFCVGRLGSAKGVFDLLDHISIRVSDYDRSQRFYSATLAPLGYELLFEHPISGAGFGRSGKPDFWIKQGPPSPSLHIAFSADDRATVDAFHKAALVAGARDHGGPGVRPEYHPTYYGGFVLDPDGHNIEAVCHKAP
jgi:catechol 2,3-dioxygenase-like lactoylglutathione lyase family enzyme